MRAALAAHKGKRSGRGDDWMMQCPAHDDSTASLHLSQGRDGALLYCHAGCSTEDICAALGITYAALFDDGGPPLSPWLVTGEDRRPIAVKVSGSRRPDSATAAESARSPQEPRSAAPPSSPTPLAAEAQDEAPAGKDGTSSPEGVTVAQLAGRFGLRAEFLSREVGLRQAGRHVMVPYRSEDGTELYAKRRLRLAGADKYRVAWPGGVKGEQTLYGLDRLPAIRAMRRPTVIFTEGETDAWCCWAYGFPALGVPGDRATGCVLAEHVRGLRHVYLCKDADQGGGEVFVAGMVERLRMVGYEGEPPRVVEMPDGLKDPGELHAADPARFAERFRATCRAAKAAEILPDIESCYIRMDKLVRKPTRFLWDPYVPERKLTILAGMPGDGKSFICAALIAAITAGAKLPNTNGHPAPPPGHALYFIAEDDPEGEEILGRLEDCGADLSLVHTFNLAQEKFQFDAAGYAFLRRSIEHYHPSIVVFDPLVSVMGERVDTNRVEQVRAALNPLVGLIQEHPVSVVAIAHFTKGGGANPYEVVYRAAGSHGFAAVVRSMLCTFRDPAAERGQKGAGVVAHAKHNLSPPGDSLRYLIEGTRLYWRGTSPLTAQDLAYASAAPPPGMGRPELEDAVAFLREELRGGPKLASVVLAAARGAMIAKATLLRARQQIGVETRKVGLGDGWSWRLPEMESRELWDRAERDAKPPRNRRREREPGDDDEEGEMPL